VPVGPRAIGMGGAFSAVADDASALFWNPAGLARIGHQEIGASHANLFGTDIRDDLVSFALPLSADRAVGADWYHSGFDDGVLGFSENRVTLGAGLRVRRWLWAGAGAKLLARSASLDGLSLTSGRGFGLDLGLLAVPADRWRLGLVGQDVTGTKLGSSDGASSVAYPRNLRLAAAYAWPRYGTVAFDMDDRWHLGLEATPHSAIALRAGAERDRGGSEAATWSMGLGIKVGMLRADWARRMPPTLASTDHFGLSLEFSFNPAQLRIEKVQAQELYTSLYKSYARDGFGSVQVRNLQDQPVTARIGIFIPDLMSAPSEQDVTLRPNAVSEVPLTAVFEEKALAQRGDQPIQVQVSASYRSLRLERREKGAGRTVAYAPGAIDWSAGMEQAAAFVTPRDPAVDELARQAGRLALALEGNPFGNRNIAFAAAMTDALADLGVAYVPDPTNPFATISSKPHAVDTVHYPFQTLERLSGDCDDTTVLTASLLGNVGVNTRFVDVPGHIFLLVDSGLNERNRSALGVDSTWIVIDDERVWIPLETTSLARGFTQAWRDGVDEIRAAEARGPVNYVDVTDAQARYEPALPPGERRIRALDQARFNLRLAAEAKTLATIRDEYFAAHFGAASRELEASADALAQVARIEFEGGDFAGARRGLEDALAKAPQSASTHNNLGVVLAAMDSLRAAEEHWSAALALGLRDPGVGLNRGIARWAAGDSVGATRILGPAIAEAGGYAAACKLIALSPEDSLDRSAGLTAEDLTLRAGLRTLLRVSTVAGIERRQAGARAADSEPVPPFLRIPGVWKYLHWIE
jgi:tetratricopeptide (TPR) repeat protein/transglutaminase-like putative cysteine protease